MANFTVAYGFTGLSLDATTQDAGVSGATMTGQALSTFAATSEYAYSGSPVFKTTCAQTSEAGALSAGTYMQFTLTPADGVTDWTPTQLAFNAARGGSSTPRGWICRASHDTYDTDLGAAEIPTTRTTWTPYTVDLTPIGTVTGPVSVRVYMYAPTSSSSIEWDDFTFTGTYNGTPTGGGSGGTVGSMGTPWIGAVTATSVQVVASQITGVTGDVRLAVSTGSTMTAPTFGAAVTPSGGVAKVSITGLNPSSEYYYRVADSNGDYVGGLGGRFRTYPVDNSAAGFTFGFSSCRDTNTDAPVLSNLKSRNPLFYIHTGDLHYRDITSNDTSLFRTGYNEWLGQTTIASLHRDLPVQYVYDDHDWGGNDSNGSATAGPACRTVYRERVPHYTLPSGTTANQTWKVGRVRFIILDVRAARSGGTILGSTQKAWLLNLLANADTKLTFIVSPVAWIGGSSDDWDGFASEQSDVVSAMNTADTECVFLCGDAHMLAIDNGSNSPGGAHVWHASSLSRSGSVKGGPYSGGTSAGSNRYGFVTVTDNGSQITATFQGINNGSTWGTDTVSVAAPPSGNGRVVVETAEFVAPSPAGTAPNVVVDAAEFVSGGSDSTVTVDTAELVISGAGAVPAPLWIRRESAWKVGQVWRRAVGTWRQLV